MLASLTTIMATTTIATTASASFAAVRPRSIPVPKKSAAVSALVPKGIAKTGAISFAEDASYAPDEFIAADGHTVIGMDADLASALAAVMGVKAHVVNATFDTIISGLSSGKYNVGLSSFTITAARAKQVNFVSYFQAGEGFYVKSSSSTKIAGLSSLCGLKVAVESGTTEQTDAQAQNTKCHTAGKAAAAVQSYADQNSANLAVSSGRDDVGFVDSQVGGYIVAQSKGTFKTAGSAIAVSPYGIAFAKTTTLDKATLAALEVLISDGIYAKILAKWGLQAGALTKPVIS
jgi:polar amino acid transport system substrate-binding protein